MSKIIVTSTDPSLTEEELEEELIKALSKSSTESRNFREAYLRKRKEETEKAVGKVLESMINEIERVVRG